MYIKSYKCKKFAGLNDMHLEFKEGLNVIYGPNESGKSTIIEGIHSVLFKDISLSGRNKADKDFKFKFFPRPIGDFIDSDIELYTGEGIYRIKKEWGENESIELTSPDKSIIKNKNQVDEKLREILHFGESTYTNVVFAKQKELKRSLFNILNNEEITQEVNDILRMAFMELDGVSIDSIEKKISEELDILYKRWDIEKNYPENNRGVSNPYKSGLGKILESYYRKENLKLAMDKAEKYERRFEDISNRLQETKFTRDKVELEKIQMEMIEDDVNNREILEIKIENSKKQIQGLMDINKQWPKSEVLLSQLKENQENIKEKRESLREEKKNIDKFKRKNQIKSQIDEVSNLIKEVQKLEEEISYIPEITIENIRNLVDIENHISKYKTTMQAGKMLGKFISVGDKPLYITKDFVREEVKENIEFEVNGLLKINYGDELALEIKTGDLDFEELNDKYEGCKLKLKNSLKSLGVESIEMAKLNLEKAKELENEIRIKNRELKLRMGNSTIEELEEEFKSLENIFTTRDAQTIEDELNNILKEEIGNESDIKTIENNMKLWERSYKDQDGLLDIILDEKGILKENEIRLQGLKPLPEIFDSTDEFKQRLSFLKGASKRNQDELDVLMEEYHDAKANLPDETFEELKKQYIYSLKEYEKYINKGKTLINVQKAFLKTKEKISGNPMEVLVEEFSKLLSIITKNKYEIEEMDEGFNLRLKNPNGEIPMELLSAGTYDSVALALRFSLIKQVFTDRKTYIILDDCLVDLDKDRKLQAVKLIKEFSKEYQIIFTTCDYETATLLGEHIIDLSK